MCHFLFVFLFILQHFIEREGEGRNRIYRQKHLPHLHIPPYIHDDVQIYITFLGIWYDRDISFGHHHSNRHLRQYWNCQILGLVSPLSCFRAETDIKIKFLHPFFPPRSPYFIFIRVKANIIFMIHRERFGWPVFSPYTMHTWHSSAKSTRLLIHQQTDWRDWPTTILCPIMTHNAPAIMFRQNNRCIWAKQMSCLSKTTSAMR